MRRISTSFVLAVPVLFTLAAGGCDKGIQFVPTGQSALVGASVTLGADKTCNDLDGYVCAGDHGTHPVTVSAFSMDQTETTVLQYAACIVAGACPDTASRQFVNGRDFQASIQNQPAQVNDPDAARAYCRWAATQPQAPHNLRLPTEAEFEYAARLGADQMLHDYPWGDAEPTCDKINYGNCNNSSLKDVGTTPADVTAAGIKDLAGSVPEWVEDSYVPFAHCADRLGYADLCSGEVASCAQTRCKADGAGCLQGCLIDEASLDSVRSGSQITSKPICPKASADTLALADPVLRTSSQFAVVRGAGPIDRACDLAAYTRRHAQPGGGYYAGFRCVSSNIKPVAPTSYRFSLRGCPTPDYPVKLRVTAVVGDKPAPYLLEEFPAIPGPVIKHSPLNASVEHLGCASTFVIRPLTPDVLAISVTDYAGCAAWDGQASLKNGGDVPASGKVDLVLGPSAAGTPGAPNACMVPNATGTCVGQCSLTCNAGYADCDASFPNGCEINIHDDSSNCGACGKACGGAAHGLLGCFTGTCKVKGCDANWADCNVDPADGCEINRDNDANNCGACRTICSNNNITHPLCAGGSCSGLCDPGYADCDGNKTLNGCEANLQNDPQNCGACKKACAAGLSCSNGLCL